MAYGALVPVGDLINGSNAAAARLIRSRDPEGVARLVARQLEAGAGALDVNARVRGGDEPADLAWLAGEVRRAAGPKIPLWIDTADPAAAEAGLAAAGPPAVLNSVPLSAGRFAPLLAVARRAGCGVVAQILSDEGPPTGTEERVARARALADALLDAGFSCREIHIDPCLLNAATEPDSPDHLMRAVLRLRGSYPECRFTAGIRNFGWGLPAAERRRREARVAADLIAVGLDSPLLDPPLLRSVTRLAAGRPPR
jgi:cobalamin-dependent methionine synthase I